MSDTGRTCVWDGCANNSSHTGSFCAEHASEILAASRLSRFAARAVEGVGWHIAGNALFEALVEVCELNLTFNRPPSRWTIGNRLLPLVEKAPELGMNAVLGYAQVGRLDDRQLGPAFARALLNPTGSRAVSTGRFFYVATKDPQGSRPYGFAMSAGEALMFLRESAVGGAEVEVLNESGEVVSRETLIAICAREKAND